MISSSRETEIQRTAETAAVMMRMEMVQKQTAMNDVSKMLLVV
jgi:hypothetical protein